MWKRSPRRQRTQAPTNCRCVSVPVAWVCPSPRVCVWVCLRLSKVERPKVKKEVPVHKPIVDCEEVSVCTRSRMCSQCNPVQTITNNLNGTSQLAITCHGDDDGGSPQQYNGITYTYGCQRLPAGGGGGDGTPWYLAQQQYFDDEVYRSINNCPQHFLHHTTSQRPWQSDL